MAKARATCTCATCGGTFYVEKMCYNRSDANSWEEWAADHYDECSDCTAKRRAAEAALQAEKDKEAGLPDIVGGSEKQIEWALRIRGDLLRNFDRIEFSDKKKVLAAKIRAWLVAEKVSARWWIDHRASTSIGGIKVLILESEDEYYAYEKKLAQQAELEVPSTEEAAEAISEAMIRPEAETDKAPVEIVLDDDAVHASYTRDDDFIRVMKGIGWKWNAEKRRWQHAMTAYSGTAQDRAGEAGNALLRAGFPVVIWDAQVREMAVNGNFIPLNARWIVMQDAKLRAVWERGNDELYHMLRKVSGAKYADGGINIPLLQWRAVQDIAEAYNFSINDKAKAAMETQKEAEENAMMRSPADPPMHDVPEGFGKMMDTDYSVLPDLKDD